jgi:hypothetical protein
MEPFALSNPRYERDRAEKHAQNRAEEIRISSALTQQQQDLAKIRRLSMAPNYDEKLPKPQPVKQTAIELSSGVWLDPSRPTMKTWPRTDYDRVGMLIIKEVVVGDKRQNDLGDGPGCFSCGPYRCRQLFNTRDKRIGAVVDLDAAQYLAARSQAKDMKPRWEPVPEDTPLSDGVLPEGWPSPPHDRERLLCAKALKKDADEISFSALVDWWKDRQKLKVECYG